MKHLRRFLAPLAAALLSAAAARAQVPTWAKTTPADVAAAGINVQLTGADYGNGTFVLATYFGGGPSTPTITPAVFTSTDGTTWTRRTVPGNGRTGAPRYVNNKFLLGVTPSGPLGNGGNGVILSSADGIAWTSSAILGATINAPGEFAYGNGLYAAPLSSSAAQVATSTDGIAWTTRTIVAGGSSSHITFFNGKFYANCYGTAAIAGLYSSADGIAWAKVGGAPANPGILAASPSTLLVTFFSGSTSGQSVSSDGVTFTTASPGINLQTETVKFLNGAFVVTASADPSTFDLTLARASLDGRTWTTIGQANTQYFSPEVAYGNGRYVFVGEFDVFSGTTTISAGGTAGSGGSTGGGSTGGGSTGGGSTGGGSTGGGTAGSAGAYLSNLSIRSTAGSGPQTLIVGVTVGGANTTGSKNVLIRGIGPTLGGFGVAGTLADPKLDVFSSLSPVAIASNDNWDATTTPVATQASVGAFALTAGSKDAALLGTGVTAGSYSVQVTGVGGTTGVALAEIYDLTPSATFTAATPRMTNISARTQVGLGGDVLITGFNISGTGTRRLLIRGIGPTLGGFGVAGTLVDPKLDVFAAGATTPLASNDNWDATATPLATQTAAGGFALTAGSKDAALIVNLAPGSYSAQVSGVNGTTGVALVEIYELP